MYLFPALLALTGTTWVYTVSDQFGGEGVVEEEEEKNKESIGER